MNDLNKNVISPKSCSYKQPNVPDDSDEEEVFFGAISEKESKIAAKLCGRKTELFLPTQIEIRNHGDHNVSSTCTHESKLVDLPELTGEECHTQLVAMANESPILPAVPDQLSCSFPEYSSNQPNLSIYDNKDNKDDFVLNFEKFVIEDNASYKHPSDSKLNNDKCHSIFNEGCQIPLDLEYNENTFDIKDAYVSENNNIIRKISFEDDEDYESNLELPNIINASYPVIFDSFVSQSEISNKGAYHNPPDKLSTSPESKIPIANSLINMPSSLDKLVVVDLEKDTDHHVQILENYKKKDMTSNDPVQSNSKPITELEDSASAIETKYPQQITEELVSEISSTKQPMHVEVEKDNNLIAKLEITNVDQIFLPKLLDQKNCHRSNLELESTYAESSLLSENSISQEFSSNFNSDSDLVVECNSYSSKELSEVTDSHRNSFINKFKSSYSMDDHESGFCNSKNGYNQSNSLPNNVLDKFTLTDKKREVMKYSPDKTEDFVNSANIKQFAYLNLEIDNNVISKLSNMEYDKSDLNEDDFVSHKNSCELESNCEQSGIDSESHASQELSTRYSNKNCNPIVESIFVPCKVLNEVIDSHKNNFVENANIPSSHNMKPVSIDPIIVSSPQDNLIKLRANNFSTPELVNINTSNEDASQRIIEKCEGEVHNSNNTFIVDEPVLDIHNVDSKNYLNEDILPVQTFTDFSPKVINQKGVLFSNVTESRLFDKIKNIDEFGDNKLDMDSDKGENSTKPLKRSVSRQITFENKIHSHHGENLLVSEPASKPSKIINSSSSDTNIKPLAFIAGSIIESNMVEPRKSYFSSLEVINVNNDEIYQNETKDSGLLPGKFDNSGNFDIAESNDFYTSCNTISSGSTEYGSQNCAMIVHGNSKSLSPISFSSIDNVDLKTSPFKFSSDIYSPNPNLVQNQVNMDNSIHSLDNPLNDTIEEMERLLNYGAKYLKETSLIEISNTDESILSPTKKLSIASAETSSTFIPNLDSTRTSTHLTVKKETVENVECFTNIDQIIATNTNKIITGTDIKKRDPPPKPPRNHNTPSTKLEVFKTPVNDAKIRCATPVCSKPARIDTPTFSRFNKHIISSASHKNNLITPTIKHFQTTPTSSLSTKSQMKKVQINVPHIENFCSNSLPSTPQNLFKNRIKPHQEASKTIKAQRVGAKIVQKPFLTPQGKSGVQYSSKGPLKGPGSNSNLCSNQQRVRGLSIVSPVAKYLQDNPPPPLIATVKPKYNISPLLMQKTQNNLNCRSTKAISNPVSKYHTNLDASMMQRDEHIQKIGNDMRKLTLKINSKSCLPAVSHDSNTVTSISRNSSTVSSPILPSSVYVHGKVLQLENKENQINRRDILSDRPPNSIFKHKGRIQVPKQTVLQQLESYDFTETKQSNVGDLEINKISNSNRVSLMEVSVYETASVHHTNTLH